MTQSRPFKKMIVSSCKGLGNILIKNKFGTLKETITLRDEAGKEVEQSRIN